VVASAPNMIVKLYSHALIEYARASCGSRVIALVR